MSGEQVVWGSIIGSLAALIWFLVTQYVLTPLYPTLASWKLAEFFLIRSAQFPVQAGSTAVIAYNFKAYNGITHISFYPVFRGLWCEQLGQ